MAYNYLVPHGSGNTGNYEDEVWFEDGKVYVNYGSLEIIGDDDLETEVTWEMEVPYEEVMDLVVEDGVIDYIEAGIDPLKIDDMTEEEIWGAIEKFAKENFDEVIQRDKKHILDSFEEEAQEEAQEWYNDFWRYGDHYDE